MVAAASPGRAAGPVELAIIAARQNWDNGEWDHERSASPCNHSHGQAG